MVASRKASNEVYIATLTALLGAICIGFACGFSSPALQTMLEKEGSVSEHRIAKDGHKALIGSSITIGAFFGSLGGGTLSRKFGRKQTLSGSGIPFAIGFLVIYLAQSVTIVIVGRIITGLMVGVVSVTAPSYISEISTPDIRGCLGAGFQLFIVTGTFIAAVFGIFATESYNHFFLWRFLGLYGILPSLSLTIYMMFVPESPTWLMANYDENSDEPRDALSRLRTEDSDIDKELHDLQKQVKEGATMKLSMNELKRPEYWKPATYGMALMFFQQFSGINIVMFFMTQILEDSHKSPDATPAEVDNYAAVGTAIISLAHVIATAVGAYLMDKLGRRKLLIISGIGHAVSLSVLGFYFFERHSVPIVTNTTELGTTITMAEKSSLPSILPVACLVVYVIAFALGYGPIPWMMIPEMTPLALLSTVSSIATGLNWGCAFIVSFTFNPVSKVIGVSTTFWFYALVCIGSCVFVYYCLPETKGKKLEEIRREFTGEAAVKSSTSLTQIPKSKSNSDRFADADREQSK